MDPKNSFGSFGIEDLRGEAAKGKVTTVDMVLRHPNHGAIVALCAGLAAGTEEDVAGAANRINGLLESDGVTVRVAATRREDDGTGSGGTREVPVIVNGQRVANFGVASLWARKPRAEDEADSEGAANRGVMIWKSWGPQGRRGFVQRFMQAANATLRNLLGTQKPASTGAGDSIPEGHAAPAAASAGDAPVDLE